MNIEDCRESRIKVSREKKGEISGYHLTLFSTHVYLKKLKRISIILI